MEEKKLTSRDCLSVVIPVYNEEATLGEIVEQVLKIPHLLEIVVVDDCSTDGSREVLREYAARDPRIRLLRNEVNVDFVHSRNRGIAEARGAAVASASSCPSNGAAPPAKKPHSTTAT